MMMISPQQQLPRSLSNRIALATIISLSLLGAGCSTTSTTSDRTETADAPAAPGVAQAPTLRSPDVVYVPTPQAVVDRMLAIAKVNSKDVLYDLGSGDGRIPITAAQKFGIRATGIDINPERIKEANTNAQTAGVTDRVRFLNQDLFQSKFSDATVVTLYLLPELNVKLRPQLFAQLKPGTRIVSHAFDMGDWKPDRTEQVGTSTIYFWTVPKNPPANLRAVRVAQTTPVSSQAGKVYAR
nr:class I SAM-dependent methyltransferase [Chamaesiphon minutus]